MPEGRKSGEGMMDGEKYLGMSVEELNRHMIPDVMANTPTVRASVDSLRSSERYAEDAVFRAFMDSAEALAFFITTRDYTVGIPLCEELLRRTEELSLWNLVSLHWNLLGSAYMVMTIYEKSIECYNRVVFNEKKHGLNGFLSTAYNNLAMTYMHTAGEFDPNGQFSEKICRYLELAIESLKEGGEDQPRYVSKLAVFTSNLIWNLIESDELTRASALIEELNALDFSEVTSEALAVYDRMRMFHHIVIGEPEKAYEFYEKTLTNVPEENAILRFLTVTEYVIRCRRAKVSLSHYEKEVLELEKYRPGEMKDTNLFIAKELAAYYELIGDAEKSSAARERMISAQMEYLESVRFGRLSSLNMVDELLKEKWKVADESYKASELAAVAEEAIRSKKESRQAYRRLQMIHALGRKLTSSMNLNEVVVLIREYLQEHVPINTFVFMISDPESKCLRSVAFYDGEIAPPEISIDWEDENSLLAECFRTGRSILIADVRTDAHFTGRKMMSAGKEEVRSAVFMPLCVRGEVIGTYSVQDGTVDAYQPEHMEFLDLLTPYLSIALNNALNSRRLEREIQDRIRTRRELEEANRKLEQLSSLDGLTRIANRREFERSLLEMLQQATERNRSVSIFMFDIDNFKKYNDTYGHLRGDEALKLTAEVLRERLEEVEGFSARFGGEEFIGACSGLSVEESRHLAERICEGVRALRIENEAVPPGILTLSVGVAVGEGGALFNKSLLMRSADTYLYEAKRGGKNRVVADRILDEG